ncbi:MAG: hypothetical protein WCX61_01820 [Candidatus Peribacteraceae bacterium]
MRTLHTVLLCGALALLVSVPSLILLPHMVPFLQQPVRAAAPLAIRELRKQGLWLVNAELQRIEQTEDGVCFHWKYRYTQRMKTLLQSESYITCI